MQRRQLLHTLAQIVNETLLHPLCAVALADVADDSDDRVLSLRIQQTDADLHRKFGPVRTPTCQLAGDRPRRWRLSVGRSLRVMGSAKSFRNDCFDIAAEQRVTRISKQALCLVVHSDDTTIGVDHEDGVGRRVDQAAEVSLALIPTLDLVAKSVVSGCQLGGPLPHSGLEFGALGCECVDRAAARVVQRADENRNRRKSGQLNSR